MSTKTRMMLSTEDNPYSPFTQWVAWYMEDLRLGHDTNGLLARLTNASDTINDEAEVAAMRDVVSNNFSGLHIVVVPEDYDS